MTIEDFFEFIFSSGATAAVLAFIAYFFRDALMKTFSKSVEHRFERKLEEVKAEIRGKEKIIETEFAAKEKQFDQIAGFLHSKKSERDTVIQAKKIEAAEIALRTCNKLFQLSPAAGIMKIFKIEIIEDGYPDPKLKLFAETMVTTLKIEELIADLGKIDQTLPTLYLNSRAQAHLNAYKTIVTHAAGYLISMSVGLDAKKLWDKGFLRDQIEALAPESKKGFDEIGIGYAYHWGQYFYDETLKELRFVANSIEQDQVDVYTAKNLAITSQLTQLKVREQIKKSGLPDALINLDVDLPLPPIAGE